MRPMAKKSPRPTRAAADKLPRPENLNIDLTKFKPDLTAMDLKNALSPILTA